MSENRLSNGSLASNATPGLSAKMISRVSNALVLAGRKAILFGQPDLVAQRSAYHRNREAHYQNLLPFLRQRSCKFASRHLLISQLAACNRFDNLRETGVATLQPLRLLQCWLQLLSEARGMRASLPLSVWCRSNSAPPVAFLAASSPSGGVLFLIATWWFSSEAGPQITDQR